MGSSVTQMYSPPRFQRIKPLTIWSRLFQEEPQALWVIRLEPQSHHELPSLLAATAQSSECGTAQEADVLLRGHTEGWGLHQKTTQN